jgi:hypothetical protein
MRSRRTISASWVSTGCRLSDANAVTRISAPSSSRMLRSMRSAMNSSTSPGTANRSCAAFLRRMAMRVSSSGGWMSVISPHSNRVRIRSSRVSRRFGGRSEDTTICLLALWRVLKVWKNSSCVPSLPSRNWMSSTSSTSTSR